MISGFRNLYDKEPMEMTVARFVDWIRTNGEVKRLTEEYRRLTARGSEGEAARVKRALPAATLAAVFEGGRQEKDLKRLTGLMMFDWDHVGAARTQLLERLRMTDCVMLAWTSVSGEGVKAVIRVDVTSTEEYLRAYRVVGRWMEQRTGCQVDEACRNVGRLCSAAHDEELYVNYGARMMAWRGLETDEDRLEVKHRMQQEVDAEGGEPQGEGSGMLQGMLDYFLQQNGFEKGHRHELLLKLGRTARCKNLSPQELEELKKLVTGKLGSTTLSESEIRKCLSDGYSYLSRKSEENVSEKNKLNAHDRHYGPPVEADERDAELDLSENNERLRGALPYFDDAIFDGLPQLLKEGLTVAMDRRERDMVLMAMLTHLSACLPDVHFHYDRHDMRPHLYFAVVAPAATGKGIVTQVSYLSHPLHDYYLARGEEEQAAYEARLQQWNEDFSERMRKGRKGEKPEPKPKEPERIYFQISPNTSKSMLYRQLWANREVSGVLHTSEIDALSAAIGQDYGKQDDVLRACFHHEPISSSFKVDGKPVFVPYPMLALCMTGTPMQFLSLVHNTEDGLFSRLAAYQVQPQYVWRDASAEGQVQNLRTHFRELGKRVLKMHEMMKGRRTDVELTREQWRRHSTFFSRKLQEVVAEGGERMASSVMRMGLIAARIAAVLTALRKGEDELWAMSTRYCSDEDLDASLAIAAVLLEHALLLSSSIPAYERRVRPLQPFARLLPVLEKLPGTFTYRELMEEAQRQELPESSVRRILKRMTERGVLKHEGKVYKRL